jgi:hypothetical protein
MRKLNYEGPLKSDYAYLCPDKLEPRDDGAKQPKDFAECDSRSFSADLDKAKPSRLQRLMAWLNTPVEVL